MKKQSVILSLMLAAALAAFGQQKAQTPAERLEEAMKPAEGTLQSDAKKAKEASLDIDAAQDLIRKLVDAVKKGPQPPAAADMAVLGKLLQQTYGKASEYSSLMADFASHSAVFYLKINDFQKEAKLKAGSPEKKQLEDKIAALSKAQEALWDSVPQRKREADNLFFDEVMTYLKAKR